jgi:MoaA/NifB/PqqE/SkfB family radical SAM enzyme
MDFPTHFSFTITNRCNLHCRMCGQWSEEGYLRGGGAGLRDEMELSDWRRLTDEIAEHKAASVLLRGGEPFLFQGIVPLMEYIHNKGIFISIDTNGTMLETYAADIIRIGNIHLTISVDGPEQIHDKVRGMNGSFAMIRKGVRRLQELMEGKDQKISMSVNFTISPYSVAGLGGMPAVARDLGIRTITIVPYYYFPKRVGATYEKELKYDLGCAAFSWPGFHHEESGVDVALFKREYEKYLADLDGIYNFPYMTLSPEEYAAWFSDPLAVVGDTACGNVERLIDIQPHGEANFCVDFPDYSMGNVRNQSIAQVWNSPGAKRFREYRRKKPLAVCYRCGAKYMSEL